MALQYDDPSRASTVLAALEDNPALSDSTIEAIAEILGLSAPGNRINVASYDGDTLTAPTGEVDMLVVQLAGERGDSVNLTLPNDAKAADVYVFETQADVTANFANLEGVVVMGAGNDTVKVTGDKSVTVDGGNGNDQITTGGGNDVVTGGAGNDTLATGAGDDTIYAGRGSDTIEAGTGFDKVVLSGKPDNYTVSRVGDALVLTNKSTGVKTTMNDTEFVEFTGGGSIAIVSNTQEAIALRLYQALLHRTADSDGAKYWSELADTAFTSVDIANSFMNSAEYKSATFGMNDAQFITMLYANALGRVPDEAGLQYHLNSLANGLTRAMVAVHIVGSPEAAALIADVQIIPGNV